MPIPITMPVLGLTMEEGAVGEWLKAVGEPVQKDEPLLTVEMDKGTVEVPSPAAGVLARIVVPPGQAVPVKTLIAELAAPGESLPTGDGGAPAPAAEEPAQASGPGDIPAAARRPLPWGEGGGEGSGSSTSTQRLFASPRARMRAAERGVDLSLLRGTGPHGRIVEDDVLGAAAQPSLAEPEEARQVASPLARRLALEHGLLLSEIAGTGPAGRITQEDVLAAAERRAAAAQAAVEPAAARAPGAAPGPGARPLTRLRRITAERMAASARSVARVTLFRDADLTEAARFRAQLAPEFARLGVAKLPWDALLAKAAGLALAEHLAVQAQWAEGQGLVQPDGVHVGVAVALEPEGLVVPVLRSADSRSLRELTADLLALSDKARQQRLGPAEMQGGTFTITNLGQYGVDGFTPILNPPETAILGVGRIAERPAVVDGQVVARTLCTLSRAFDHRAVDGAPAAAFLARLAELLERPYALLGV